MAAAPLQVSSDFEGASVRDVAIDNDAPPHHLHARRRSDARLAVLVVLSRERDHAG
jgi:hypothetical protein